MTQTLRVRGGGVGGVFFFWKNERDGSEKSPLGGVGRRKKKKKKTVRGDINSDDFHARGKSYTISGSRFCRLGDNDRREIELFR